MENNERKIKIAYLSHTQLSDVDISYLHTAQKTMDITYYVEVSPRYLKGAAFNLSECYPHSGVFGASIYPQLDRFNEVIDAMKFRVINTNGKRWLIRALITYFKLFRELKSENYDVIHITWPLNFYELILYFFRKKIVLTVHDPLPHSSDFTLVSKIRRYMAFRFLERFIILNKNQKESFIEYYHLRNKKVFVSSLSCYSYLPQITSSQQRVHGKSILFFGKITAYKGLEYLFPAFEIVHKKHTDVTLIVAGNGEYYFDIAQYKEKNYFKIINRYIPDNELSDLIRDTEFSICPYKDATQSGVAMSAFAFHKPVVATNVGGLPEMLGHGRYGVLVPPCDVDALANAINRLLDDPEDLKRLSSNIERDYSYGELSWQHICEQHQMIYLSI